MRTEKPFFDRGGKLLVWHGWPGRQTPPLHGVEYYSRARTTARATTSNRSIRRLLVPGMGGGDSGQGTDVFDSVAPLSARGERGARPQRIEATRVKDGVVSQPPLCLYGAVARWDGRGDTTWAASFARSAAAGGAGKR